MRFLLYVCTYLVYGLCHAQSDTLPEAELADPAAPPIEIFLERPVNIFAAAGIQFPLTKLYHVVISPIDLHVKLEPYSPISSNITTGLVWNPFMKKKKQVIFTSPQKWHWEHKRKALAVALLVNLFDLSFASSDTKMEIPLDVGFGLGYRRDDFLILFTTEFKAVRQPYRYFIDTYKHGDKPLQYFVNEVPEIEIEESNDTFFTNKIVAAIGFKIAFAFTKK